MRLSIKSVEFKNFLSFGARLQKLTFTEGVHFVLGEDKDKGRSNGAGKTSLLQTIPFALYGRTHKEVKKEQIINWKNQKDCQVLLNFSKGTDDYTINRCIKPDILEIFKNDSLIDKLSDVRDYQKLLEEILGIDFQAFSKLIHTNINSSQPLLSLKKADKRKLMEGIFNVDVFSKISENTNEKLRKIKSSLKESETLEFALKETVKESKERLEKLGFNLRSLSSSSQELKDKEERFEEYKEEHKGIEERLIEISNRMSKIDKEKNFLSFIQVSKLVPVMNSVSRKIGSLKTDAEKLKISMGDRKKYEEGIELLKQLLKEFKELGDSDEIERKDEHCDSLIKEFYETKGHKEKEIASRQTELDITNRNIESLKNDLCPTCGQDTHGSPVKEKLLSTISSLEFNIKENTEYLEKYVESGKLIYEEKNRLKELSKTIKEKRDLIQKKKKEVEALKPKDVEDQINKLEGKRQRFTKALKKLENYSSSILRLMDKLNDKLISVENEKEEADKIELRIRNFEKELNFLAERVEMERKNREAMEALLSTEYKQISEKKLKLEELGKEKEKLVSLSDYLEFIKILCKDENLKQYAISSRLPYFSSRVNHYLSEVGYPFHLDIDNWVDIDIKGPGVRGATYNSLSGGERKGVDLSLQFGFLDVYKLMAAVNPDMLVIDELLDSSIDSIGLSKLLKIVETKQKEDQSKTLIISHRREIDEYEPDGIIKVIKENGFSKIEQ